MQLAFNSIAGGDSEVKAELSAIELLSPLIVLTSSAIIIKILVYIYKYI